MLETLPLRIRTKFLKTDSCWLWQAWKYPSGYGAVRYLGRDRPAHRVIYELLRGKIPEGLQLDHLCRNRACVNPAHLEPVTCAENLRRGIGQLPHEYCRRGHPMTPDNLIFDTPTIRRCKICSRAKNRAHYERSKNAH